MITLTPAYGRDYKSKAAVILDFNDNKDFILNDITHQFNGKPCNKSDLLAAGVSEVQVRYKTLTQVFIQKIKGEQP